MLKIEDYRDQMEKCAHCGNCQSVCPVYQADLLEPYVARARINLIKNVFIDGAMEPTQGVRDIINHCLVCSNCTQVCASGVAGDEIVIAARAALFKKYGSAGGMKSTAMHQMFNRRGLAGILGKAGVLAQKMHLAPAGMPKLADRFFDQECRGVFPAKGEMRARVAYYVGCGTNFMFPDTGHAVIDVLTRNGIEVVVPDGLSCCGIPAMSDGNLEAARQGAANNIKILASLDVDAIITDCTSCGLMLTTRTAKLFAEDDPLQNMIKKVASKSHEVTDYLNKMGLVDQAPSLAGSFTYHVPCHRSWSPTVADAPRGLLEQVEGLERREMDDPEACCGAGGTFYMGNPETAQRIREKKALQMEKTGAKWVVTQCPVCRFYLSEVAGEKKVIHPVALLAKAYGGDV